MPQFKLLYNILTFVFLLFFIQRFVHNLKILNVTYLALVVRQEATRRKHKRVHYIK